jgi:hypothetical protein
VIPASHSVLLVTISGLRGTRRRQLSRYSRRWERRSQHRRNPSISQALGMIKSRLALP